MMVAQSAFDSEARANLARTTRLPPHPAGLAIEKAILRSERLVGEWGPDPAECELDAVRSGN